MSTEELIAKARALLDGTSPEPWRGRKQIIDMGNYMETWWTVKDAKSREIILDIADCSDNDRNLIEAAPTIIRELVESLEALVKREGE